MNEWVALLVSVSLLGGAVWLSVKTNALRKKIREQDKEIEAIKQQHGNSIRSTGTDD